jgi:hypothetical protein
MSPKANRPEGGSSGPADCKADDDRPRNPAPIKARRKAQPYKPVPPQWSDEQRAWVRAFWRTRDAERALRLLRSDDPEEREEGAALLFQVGMSIEEAWQLVRGGKP